MRSARLFRNDNAVRVFRPFWDSSRSQKFGGSSLTGKKQESADRDPYEGNFIFTECDQYTKVTVIGAAGRVGKTLSLLLKTCPLIDHLCLFDTDKSVKGVGVDISHVDTKCSVSYVCGMRNIHQALDAPDVVIVTAGCPASPTLGGRKLFEKNAPIVAGLSEACARFCPKACVVLVTSPINSLLPVMGEVYQIITNRIPSRKLFGLTTLDVVRANTFVAEVVRKDPNSVIVPVIGGTSQETIVPVFSQMKPCCRIKKGEMIALTECLKRAEGNLADCQNCGTRGASSLSTAYAGFRFTSSLVMALKGADDIIECAFVKSEVIPELEYMASPLKLGIRGIEHNFGYPPLSEKTAEEKDSETPAHAPLSRRRSGFLNVSNSLPSVRNYHTINEERNEKFKKYLMEDRRKTLVPVKRTKLPDIMPAEPAPRPQKKKSDTVIKRQVWEVKIPSDQYKNLNATAKQKYRSFNVHKKFTPSASVILLTDKNKTERARRNIEMALRNRPKPETAEESIEIEEEKEFGNLENSDLKDSKELMLKSDTDDVVKYKEYIFQQLRQIKRENEELKKRLSELMEDKNIQNALQAQSDSLELERTKLKACWVIMSSTMEAFSNFCKKFTTKSDEQILDEAKQLDEGQGSREADEEEEEEEEEEKDEEEEKKDRKLTKYEENYYRFLEKLMDGRLEGEKKRSQKL